MLLSISARAIRRDAVTAEVAALDLESAALERHACA
jgi:hypothetical protein